MRQSQKDKRLNPENIFDPAFSGSLLKHTYTDWSVEK